VPACCAAALYYAPVAEKVLQQAQMRDGLPEVRCAVLAGVGIWVACADGWRVCFSAVDAGGPSCHVLFCSQPWLHTCPFNSTNRIAFTLQIESIRLSHKTAHSRRGLTSEQEVRGHQAPNRLATPCL